MLPDGPYKLRFGGAFFFDSKGGVSSPPFLVEVRWRPASGPPGTPKWGPGFGSCRRRYSARSQGTCRTVRGQRLGGRARTRRGSFQLTRPIRGQCGSACPLCGGNSACQQAEIGQPRFGEALLLPVVLSPPMLPASAPSQAGRPMRRSGAGKSSENTARMNQNPPVAVCTRCGAVSRVAQAINQRCGAKYGGKRCRGTYQRTQNPDDWEECPTCSATGKVDGRKCDQCTGVGWLYVRKG